jgi:hypothetical protein
MMNRRCIKKVLHKLTREKCFSYLTFILLTFHLKSQNINCKLCNQRQVHNENFS